METSPRMSFINVDSSSSIIDAILPLLESLRNRSGEKLTIIAEVSALMERLRGTISKEDGSFSNAQKSVARSESLKFQVALGAFGQVVTGEQDEMKSLDLLNQMHAAVIKIHQAISENTKMHIRTSPSNATKIPSTTDLRQGNSFTAKEPQLSPSSHRLSISNPSRPRAASISIPKKIRSMTISLIPISNISGSPKSPSQNSSPLCSPLGSPQSSSPTFKNDDLESLKVKRNSGLPPQLRWSITTHIDVPETLTEAECEDLIEKFFHHVVDLKNFGLGGSKQKNLFSPRVSKNTKTKRSDLENQITKVFGNIEPILLRNDWSKLFHVRVRLKRSLLAGSSIDMLHELVSFVTSNTGWETVSESTINHIKALGEFLNTYVVDTDSAVIGLELHKALRSYYCFPPLSGNEDKVGYKKNKEVPVEGRLKDYNTLRDKIISLSEYSNAERVFQEVKDMASWLRQERTLGLKKGDVVVAQWSPKNEEKCYVTYCRMIQWMNENTVKLFNGRSLIVVDVRQCHPLSVKVKEAICRGHISQCILDHYQHVKELIMAQGREFLLNHIFEIFENERSMDMQDIKRSLTGSRKIQIFDIENLRSLSNLIQSIQVSNLGHQEGFFRRCSEIASAYFDQLTVYDICARDVDNIISKLANVKLQFSHFLIEVYNEILAQTNTFVASLEERCEDLLNGTRKNALSNQWHTSVRESVNLLLEKFGYAPDAAPHDYISQPPRDIKLIEENLAILQCLLKNEDGNDDLAVIGRNLVLRFYPKIQEFEEAACGVASLKFGYNHVLDYEQLQRLVEERDSKKQDYDRRIKDMLCDLVYLREMKRLEDNPLEKSHDIVPISGLVISSVARKEKEMQTILEVWK